MRKLLFCLRNGMWGVIVVVQHNTVALLLHCRSPIRYALARGIGRFITRRQDWSVRWLWGDADDVEVPAGCDGVVVVSDDAVSATRIASDVRHCVVTGCQPETDAVAAVYCDPTRVGQIAAEHFCDLGYQSLAFLGFQTVADQLRWSGFRDVARKHDLLPIEHQLPSCDAAPSSGSTDQELRDWITKIPRKTGIFVTDDRRAANLCELAREANLSIPEDLAIISLGHDPDATMFARPRLSFIDVPWEHVGFQAAELLSGMLEGEPPRHIIVEPNRVVQRASTQGMAIDDKQILAAVNFIRAHAHQPIGVRDVLKASHASRRALEQKFRHILRRTIMEEIRRARVDLAIQLIADERIPLNQIAARCGLTTSTQLSQLTRRYVGATPLELRRRGKTK